jgi:Ca2+-transporting ATPase
MTFLGMQAMHDPPRQGVRNAISQCRKAGIRIVMITGDNMDTAKAIAKEIGMGERAMQGYELEGMSDHEVSRAVEETDIFARVSPEHKVKVLKALQANGRRVAITGDGVNDAPALKSSDVGVAMGLRGSDVAKAASDMILLDDNFSTIVSAIREGRVIFSNIRKFVTYLLTCNLAEVLVVFFASLFGYIAITPVHLLWINLLTDGAPAIALAADPAGGDVMRKKPRKHDEGIISRDVTVLTAGVGIVMTVLILLIFRQGLSASLATAQSMVFTSFVVFEFVRIASIRQQEKLSWASNKYLLLAIAFSMLMQLAVMYTPISSAFGVVPLGFYEWSVILAGAAAGWAAGAAISIVVSRRAG